MKASMAFCKEMMFHTGTAVPGLSETSREAKFGELGAANVAGPCCPVCQLPPSFCSGLPPLLHFCLDVTSLPCTSVAPVTYTTRREKAEPGKHREQIPPRLVLQHAGIWLPSTGAPGPLRGKGQAMSGSLPSLQGCSTLPPPLPPSLPPAAFLAPSGERCWESNTTGPIQLSLLPGEQTPAQELGSCWTAGGTRFPLFLRCLLRSRYPPVPGCTTTHVCGRGWQVGAWPMAVPRLRMGSELGTLHWWHSLLTAWEGCDCSAGGAKAGLVVVAEGQSGDMGLGDD